MPRTKSLYLKILAASLILAIFLQTVPASTGVVLFSSSAPAIPLTPSFSFSPSNPGVGKVVTFAGSASGGTSPYSFSWNFGDGVTASGATVKHIFINLQTFTVTLTVTDSIGGTGSTQNPVYLGSLNPRVNCTPSIVRIAQITANKTQSASLSASAFSPGITTTVSGGVAKRWLTPGPTPSGWHSPGPSCIITNNFGQAISVYVEIDSIKRASITTEDSASTYDATNGGGSMPGGSQSDSTFNSFDPAIVSNYGSSCTSASDPTCYGRIHNEMDHDWKAAGYCGTGTACDPSALSGQTSESSTLIDLQGFVYWDPANLNAADHQFSGWELHPLTGWRIHRNPLTVSIGNSPSSPGAGQSVTFTGTASGGSGSYTFTWDFGDGTSSTGNPVSHTYPAGSYNVHLSVTDSNSATGVTSKTIVVGGSTPDFSMSSNPSSLTIQSGSSGTSTINLLSLGGFSGTVSLSPLVSPSGLTASLNPTSVILSSGTSASSTLTVSSSTPGTYTVTVTGTSGSISHTTTVTVVVGSAPDFTISSNPTSLTIQSGSSGTSTITLASVNTFAGLVTLSASVSPSGLTGSLNPLTVSLSSGGTGSSILTVSSSTSGTYNVNVTGTSGSLSHSTVVTVSVVPGPDFSISGTPASLWVQSGSSATSTIQVSSLNGFSGTVALSTSVFPTGLTASLNPASIGVPTGGSASSTLTLSSSTAANYNITVTGTNGTLSHSATVEVTGVSALAASDSTIGPSSLGTAGGGKLIQDSAGRMIAVYVDSSGRIGLVYANSNPMLAGWSAPVKSPTPTSPYTWPAAVLVSLTSLRIIAGGGSGSGTITDIPVTVQRDSQNNITGFSYGTPVTLDSSGLGRYPTSVLAHNGNVLLAWAWQNSTRTMVKSLRWNPSTGWTGFSGSSSSPDIALVSVNVTWFIPSLIERQDNNNVYLLANRLSGPPSTLAYNTAPWTGSSWTWGSQNLTYEAGVSSGAEDPVSLAWDPVISMVVVSYGITGTTSFGVFTLNSLNQKTHLDTPSLPITERDWGTISVHITSGDYYIFLMNVNTDGGSGTVGYIRHPAGGSWSSTFTLLDSATDNQGLSIRPTGTSTTLDLMFAEGTSAPARIKTIRLNPFNPPNFSLSASPTSGTVPGGSSAVSTITVSSLYNFTGIVTFSATVSPSGLTASLSPASVNLTNGGTATSTLTVSSTTSGTYTITIQATSGSLTHSTTVIIHVDLKPTVSFTESTPNAFRDQPVTVTISSADPDGIVTTITVNWGDGTIDSLAGTTTTDTHAYVKANTYTINVTATDNGGMTASATASITISDAPPTVTFTAAPTTANTGQTITLTISSNDPDGSITQTVVNWGDGWVHTFIGAASSDSHSYASTGNAKTQAFTILVTVTDNATLTRTDSSVVTINNLPPTALFTRSPSSTLTAEPINFNATGSSDPDGTVTSYSWAFGDGQTATGAVVSHSYSNTGNAKILNFTVTLTVTDNSGNTATAQSIETITNRHPTASFTASTMSALTGVSITFNATSSNDPDGSISTYSWTFGDGNIATGRIVTHSYATTGNSQSQAFTVSLTVTDNSDNSGAVSSQVTIIDRSPIASFTESTQSASTGVVISFNATASSDADGIIVTYSWNFGDGSPVVTLSNPIASHNYSNTGNSKSQQFTVTLTVVDNSGSTGSSTAQVTIINRSPVASFTESTTSALTGVSISFNATSSFDPDGTIVAYSWNFGDGATGTGRTVSHSYADTGGFPVATYNVTLIITDNSGNTGTAVSQETIADRPPSVSVTVSTNSAFTGVRINLTITSSDTDGTISQTVVTWGDGTTHTLTGAATGDSHSYSSTGNNPTQTFNITVTVTDNSGNTSASSLIETINDVPPTVSFTESATSVPTGTPLTLTISASDPDGSITSLSVVWGDGTIDVLPGTATTDSHAYPLAGSYNIYVNATDNSNLTTKGATTTVAISDRPPIARFTSNHTSVLTNSPVAFDASTSIDPDGTIVGYAWNFGDGTSGSGATISHAYVQAGNYSVALTVTDNNGNTDTAKATEMVLDRPPIAGFSYTTDNGAPPVEGQAVRFDGSSSTDLDGTVVAYSWSFGDGSVGSVPQITHSFTSNGSYVVSLTVTDNSGNTGTTTATISVGVDTVPPNWLPNSSLTITNIHSFNSTTRLTLSWTPPASDNGAIAFYKIYLNNSLIGTVPGYGNSYNATGLAPGAYGFRVEAVDYGGLSTTNGPVATLVVHRLTGDVNNDCRVDISDLTLVASVIGTHVGDTRFNPSADLNGDGIISIEDIVIVASKFGQAC